MRIRTGKRGRRGKKGRRRFRVEWREPKIITITVINEKGKKAVETIPLYDCTLGDADATFQLLVTELSLRGADAAREIIIAADGALWIWNRADMIAEALGWPPERLMSRVLRKSPNEDQLEARIPGAAAAAA